MIWVALGLWYFDVPWYWIVVIVLLVAGAQSKDTPPAV